MSTNSPQENLNISVVQLQSTESIEDNLKQIKAKISSIPDLQEKDLISLPENCLQYKITSPENFGVPENHDCFDQLSEFASKNKVAFHLGGVPLRQEGSKESRVDNVTLWIHADGKREVVYKKTHLFDLELPELVIKESDTFKFGDGLATAQFKGWKLGFGICYDIRFTELIRLFFREKVDLVFFPAAFTVPTGKAHWKLLNRARAVELQCYVASAAQGGYHKSPKGDKERTSWGQSLVVSPWGEVLKQGPHFDQDGGKLVLNQTLHYSEIEKVRRSLPMQDHVKDQSFYKIKNHFDLN